MSIGNINNGESGSSVRSKLNSLINTTNDQELKLEPSDIIDFKNSSESKITISMSDLWASIASMNFVQLPTSNLIISLTGDGSTSSSPLSLDFRAGPGGPESRRVARFSSSSARCRFIPPSSSSSTSLFATRGFFSFNIFCGGGRGPDSTAGISLGDNLNVTSINKSSGSRIGVEFKGELDNISIGLWRITNNNYSEILFDPKPNNSRGRYILAWDGEGNLELYYSLYDNPISFELLGTISGAPTSSNQFNTDIVLECFQGSDVPEEGVRTSTVTFGSMIFAQ